MKTLRSIATLSLVLLGVLTSACGSSPTAPSTQTPNTPPVVNNPGVTYMAVPSSMIKVKKDGVDTPFSYQFIDVLPALGSTIYGTPSGSPAFGCGDNLATGPILSLGCFQYKLQVCNSGTQNAKANVYLSPNPGEVKYLQPGVDAGPGCHTVDRMAVPIGTTGLSNFSPFPTGTECCRYMDIDIVLNSGVGKRGDPIVTESVLLGYTNRIQ